MKREGKTQRPSEATSAAPRLRAWQPLQNVWRRSDASQGPGTNVASSSRCSPSILSPRIRLPLLSSPGTARDFPQRGFPSLLPLPLSPQSACRFSAGSPPCPRPYYVVSFPMNIFNFNWAICSPGLLLLLSQRETEEFVLVRCAEKEGEKNENTVCILA